MSTTAIFAEILIVGLEASVWLLLLFFSFYPPDSAWLERLKDWEYLVTVLVLAAAYALGILVDRVSDSVFTWLLDSLKKTRLKEWIPYWRDAQKEKKPEKLSIMRLRMMEREDGRIKFLEYQRSRLRIARATVVNLFCLLLASALFFYRSSILLTKDWLVLEFFVLVFLVVSVFAAIRIDHAYNKRLVEAYRMWLADSKVTSSGQPVNPAR